MRNKNLFLKILLIIFFYIGCSSNIKSIKFDENLRAEGNISKDKIFNGLIKFYDLKSNDLVRQCVYSNGVLNGERIDYYDNGTIEAKIYYNDGKLNGYGTTYNEKGLISSKTFYYYDLRIGEYSELVNGIISNYWFNSLDGKELFHINYDSAKSKIITNMQASYFFYHKQTYQELNNQGINRIEFFLYTPNPPKYNFRYSLIKTDKNYTKQKVLQTFDNSKPWSVFSLNKEELITDTLNSNIALKLSIFDSIAEGDIIMYKVLNLK